jgi:DNA/RNA endonuclease YhcR with UshA esterase domain
MKKYTLCICLILALGAISLCNQRSSARTITAAEAKDHVGEEATVCGKVVSTRYAARSPGSPTFLNLDRPYPDQTFTIVIWGRDRAKFDKPEVNYKDKRICVTGKIESHRGIPEIVVKMPEQIEVEKQ